MFISRLSYFAQDRDPSVLKKTRAWTCTYSEPFLKFLGLNSHYFGREVGET